MLRSALKSPLLQGMAVGAILLYFLDPDRGKSRRARGKDQVMGLVRRGGRRADRLGRRLRARAHGVKERTIYGGGQPADVDDGTLLQRVRSELFAGTDVPSGQIKVNVEDGVVVLRGVADPEQAESLTKASMRIPGVRGVETLLHLPGTPAPNKAPSREASISRLRP